MTVRAMFWDDYPRGGTQDAGAEQEKTGDREPKAGAVGTVQARDHRQGLAVEMEKKKDKTYLGARVVQGG